jgi:hypothetical protein
VLVKQGYLKYLFINLFKCTIKIQTVLTRLLDDTPVKVNNMLICGHALPFRITLRWILNPTCNIEGTIDIW